MAEDKSFAQSSFFLLAAFFHDRAAFASRHCANVGENRHGALSLPVHIRVRKRARPGRAVRAGRPHVHMILVGVSHDSRGVLVPASRRRKIQQSASLVVREKNDAVVFNQLLLHRLASTVARGSRRRADMRWYV